VLDLESNRATTQRKISKCPYSAKDTIMAVCSFSLIAEVYQLSQSIDNLTNELSAAESNVKKLRDDHQMLVKEIEMKKNSLYIDQQKSMPVRMRYPSVQRLLGYNA
jgi:uncharacterized protein (DUF342 family)